ncbi:hypothetical protein NQZ68_017789 [Dissostichus eleginoides]|nr:hypothetical protein NQZ68_017789 [Dissostichus eleginoides]
MEEGGTEREEEGQEERERNSEKRGNVEEEGEEWEEVGERGRRNSPEPPSPCLNDFLGTLLPRLSEGYQLPPTQRDTRK